MKYIISIALYFILVSCSIKNNDSQNLKDNNNKKEPIDSLINQVKVANKNKDYQKSLFLLQNLILLDSTRGDFYYKLGDCKARLLDYEGSSKNYLQAILLNYRAKDAYFNIGCNYAIENKDSIALKYFIEAFRLDSTDIGIKIQIEGMKKRLLKD